MKQILLLSISILLCLSLVATPVQDEQQPVQDKKEQASVYGNGDLKIFPNPANDYIRIANGENIKNVLVINIVGKTVLSFQNINPSEKLDISDLNSGLYLVKLMGEDMRNIKTLRLSKR